MVNINVKYLGLELSSPIIASSSGLTSKIESIKELEKNGVGAIILKSIFEEQIMSEITHNEQYSDYPDSADFINTYIKDNNINNYLDLIRSAKKECNIPIIASICCVNNGDWKNFAKEIEGAGADAIELNIYYLPISGAEKSNEIEQKYLQTAANVAESVNIPVSVKIGSHFTNTINICKELYFRKIKGVTMFNRFLDPDIDINNLSLSTSDIFSSNEELRHSLRWISMASSVQPEIEYSASTGVHSGKDVIKMLLVGATTVQVCSLLYKQGASEISKMNQFIEDWMREKEYKSISDFKGILNYKNSDSNIAYERSQFMKYYSSHK